MRKSILVLLAVVMLFLIPVLDRTDGGNMLASSGASSQSVGRSVIAEGQSAYTGKGNELTVQFKGVFANGSSWSETNNTLAEDLTSGTTFYVSNNSVTDWIAYVLVSPPYNISSMNFTVTKPPSMPQPNGWNLTDVIDPNGVSRLSEVTDSNAEVTVPTAVVDVFGLWKFEFNQTNGATNLQCGINGGSYATTFIYDVGDSASFKAYAPDTDGSAMRLILTGPDNETYYSTTDSSQHVTEHSFEWTGITILSSWPAGVWHADVNFNNTGGAAPKFVGRYKRSFIVKHDTSLTLQSPGDAVSDKLSVRTAGEMLYIEVQLMDDDNSQIVIGATVTMNWTVSGSPSDVTLEDYGTGDYGVALNTSDLGDATRWRIEIDSYHQYYNNATTYFDLDLFHSTELTYISLSTTPVGSDSTVTLVYRDTYDDVPIIGATIVFTNGTLANVVAEGGGQYNLSVNTGSLGLGDHCYIFNASKSGSFVEMANTNITFTMRTHYTSVTVIGDLVTPHGETTPVTVVITDLDTGTELGTTTDVTTWSFTSGYAAVTETPPADFDVTLTTNTWALGSETVTLAVTMSGIYENPTNYLFDVEIRKHYTSVTVIGDLVTPHGQTTPVTVVITDLDTGTELGTTTDVTTWSFTSGYTAVTETPPADFDVILTTNTWALGTEAVTLAVTMSGIYENPTSCQFDVEIRKHYTSVTVIGDLVTPHGQTTPVTVVITDLDTGTELGTTTDVTTWSFTSGYTAVTETPPGDFDVILTTNTWALGTEAVTLAVTMSGIYENPTNYLFDVEIRKHYTSVTVIGDLVTPSGQTTPVTVVITDLDTGVDLGTTTDVTTWSFTSGYAAVTETPPADFDVTLTTNTWALGTEAVTLAVTMSGIYENPTSYQFDVEIRKHYTSVTVLGGLVTPHGQTTPVTVVITDLDTGVDLGTTTDVTTWSFTSGYAAVTETPPADFDVTLTTNTWALGTEAVTLAVTMSGIYENPTSYQFDVEIRKHYTSVTVLGGLVTPHGQTTPVTVVITDLDTGTELGTTTDVTTWSFTSGYTAVTETPPGDFDVTLTTNTWALGTEAVTLAVTMSGIYENPTSCQFDVEIRKHYTSVTVIGDLVTPHGQTTPVTVVITDLDTGTELGTTTDVTTWSFTSGYTAVTETPPGDFDVILTTNTWALGTEAVTLAVTMSGIYENPTNYLFDVEIRKHYTSVTVIGNLVTPSGQTTPVTVVITDLDTGVDLGTTTDVTTWSFTSGYAAVTETPPADFDVTLTTNTWALGTEAVTLAVTMSGIYENPTSYQFDVEIRKHYTSVTVLGGLVTPHGQTTPVTVVITDLDTGVDLGTTTDVTTWSFTSGYAAVTETPPADFDVTLTTNTWALGTEAVTLAVTMSGIYENPTSYQFDVEIRKHYTSVTVLGGLVTPHGQTTPVTVVITDLDTGTELGTTTDVTTWSFTSGYTAVTETPPGDFDVTLTTNTWALGTEAVTLAVTMSGIYENPTSCQFDVEIRKHYTSVTVIGDLVTPHGQTTPVTVVITDLDTGTELGTTTDVTTWSFTSGYTAVTETPPGDFDVILTTNTWALGTEAVTLAVTMSGIYENPTNYLFDVEIRKHYTSVTVIGNLVTPHGQTTPVTVVITDLDTGVDLSSTSSITSWSFTSGYAAVTETPPGDFDVILTTNTWALGSETVTLAVTMSGIYENPTNYLFDVEIRKHYTSVTVIGDLVTPHGQTTPVTVVITDLDTGVDLGTTTDVTTWSFTSGYAAVTETPPADFDVTLTTNTWALGTEAVTLAVTMSGIYENPTSYQFDVEIRKHYTSVTVLGGLVTPHGQTTPVTVVITDLDTGTELGTTTDVTTWSFTSGYTAVTETPPGDFDVTLTTNTWALGTEAVTLAVTMSGIYENPTSYLFDVEIRKHYTSVTVIGDLVTPSGQTTPVTVVITDLDTGTELGTTTDVTTWSFTSGYAAVTETPPADFDVTLTTNTWALGSETVTLAVTMSSIYENPTNYLFDVEIRTHYTSVTVIGNLVTPSGQTTPVTVVITDLDTGVDLSSTSSITSWSFTSTNPAITETPPGDFDVTLTTNTWSVGPETVTLAVIMSGIYENPTSYQFDIQVRNHYTTISVSGGLVTPFGNVTPLTIVITDIDTLTALSASDVSIFTFVSSYSPYSENNPLNLGLNLPTNTWSVGIETVTLSVTMTGNYDNPTNYQFNITIRSMSTYMYNEPSGLIYPSGDDFEIYLRVNVSELGASYGLPVKSLTPGEFTVESYTISIDTTGQSIGRYKLTIAGTSFGDGDYTITVHINPSNQSHASAVLVISFTYRPARSFLSSPNYPQVTTPFEMDVQITLNYTDVDRELGIDGAIIGNESINIYTVVDALDGTYTLWIDVAGLSEGPHEFNLTANKDGYELKYLTFTVLIRVAYTYAIPTVGALDIPVGNDPQFYVKYWDIDHDEPVLLASWVSDWDHDLIVVYIGGEERYQVTLPTLDADALRQNYVVNITFYKDNYQNGTFTISITIRTHNTDFRLVSAVEPTSYIGVINISVYYGDLDNPEGIKSHYAEFRVENASHDITFNHYNDTVLGPGFYILSILASQFPQGMQTFTVYVNWTGSVYTYQNKTLVATANIVGVESSLTLLIASEPTPYLGNMSYTFFYSDITSGQGISNASYGGGNVHIYVSFQGESVDPSLIDIWEVNQVGQPGNYSIQFNTTIFGHTGLIYMNVYINWSRGAAPYYANRTDVISVRILARDTLVSIIPPTPTSYGENATFSFSYDDVTTGIIPIDNNPALSISLNLAEYALSYNSTTKLFTVSFDTSQFGAPLGQKPFTLDVEWAGAPFYANRTGRTITVTVIARLTVLDYQSPAPTPYMNNVTFLLNWTDVTTTSITGVTGATVTLHDEGTPIPSMYYTWIWIQDGEYSVEFNTTYYAIPGTYDLEVRLTSLEFYISDKSATRSFNIMYRVTLLSFEPTDKQPYNSSLQFVLNFQDLLTLNAIGNGSSHVTLELLNGSSWFYSIEWKPAFQHYEFIVETYNHFELVLNTEYTFWLSVSYASLSPFYGSDETYVTFELRERTSSLDLEEPPDATPYLDYAVFQVFYRDVSSSGGIVIGIGDFILQKGVTVLVPGTNYSITDNGDGYYTISVNTTVLDGLDITEIDVFATWIGGSPYHEAADRTISIRVTKRETNVEITVPPLFTQYLDNVTFTFTYTDLLRGTAITSITVSNIELWADGVLLSDTDFIMNQVGSAFFVSVNSTILNPNLVSNYNLTVKVDWNDASPPFYFDDTTIVKVTTITRLIAYSIDLAQDAKLGDNIIFSFTLSDADSGALVVGALIGFDGQTDSLIQDVDFWVVEGTGSDLGRYTIHIDSLALFDIDRYRFDLNVSWNPSTQPFYANMSTVVLTASVREIETELVLFEDQVSVLWTELANISVDYRNFFMNNLTPGATVTWDWPGVDQGSFTEVGSTGTYVASINTAPDDIGTKILIIEAQKNRFETAIIYVTIIVRSLPSAMIGINPSAAVISLDRGAAVDLIMYLEDVVNSAPISNLYVTSEVWAELEGQFFYLSYNGTPGYYTTIIPAGDATLLEVGSYDVRLAAVLLNYEPGAHSFKIMLDQSRTQLLLAGDTTEDMPSEFTEVVEFRVDLVLPDIGNTLFCNATVSWVISELGRYGNFTNTGNGTYFVVFNTTDIGFGIWPISFRARPWANASDYASSATQITLTIKRIATIVEREASELDLVWGWNGNITFLFNGTFGPITGAIGAYNAGPYKGNATDLGNGTYVVPFDTRALNPGATYELSIDFLKENYQRGPSSVSITILYIPTELILNISGIYEDPVIATQYVVPYGETLGIALFYNDTDSSEGYVGGLENANLTLNVIYGPTIVIPKLFTIEELGGGHYRYLFDTTDISLLFPGSQPGPKEDYYTLTFRLALANRTTALWEIRITIIPLPTATEIVSMDTSLEYGQTGQMVVKFIDIWRGHPNGTLITGANFTIDDSTVLELLEILDTYEDPARPGYYIIEYRAASILIGENIGISIVDIILLLPNAEPGTLDTSLRVTVYPTEAAQRLYAIFMFGTPSLFIIVLLAILYVKIWSVPKRLRQINSQVKSLSKGKIPKPIEEVKSRQEMIADLFNDTFQELELTRTAYQMPAESVEADIPEMGELLIQLSILTNLSPTELDEFKADISKMRMSEQAAFVKEVIHQESIRVARVENKTPDEVVEEIAEEAKKRLAGDEAIEASGIDLDIALAGPMILAPEDEKTEDVITAITREAEDAFVKGAEGMTPSSDRLSDFEINELKKNLEQRGVPLHEIDTILEQARSLPRDLVEELVKSLESQEE